MPTQSKPRTSPYLNIFNRNKIDTESMQEIIYPYRYEIDTRKEVSENDFIVKWFSIKKIDTIKVVIRHESRCEVDNTICLFGKTEDYPKNGAQIFV